MFERDVNKKEFHRQAMLLFSSISAYMFLVSFASPSFLLQVVFFSGSGFFLCFLYMRTHSSS